MLISYIIPLYNCEKYIARCIESILNLGISESLYEIIVINDGSTDNGPNVVQSLCDEYCSIKQYSQCNKGVSVARNNGLTKASGDYIHFIDADDYIVSFSDEGLKELFKILQTDNIDLININSQIVYNSSQKPNAPTNKELEKYNALNYCTDFGFSPSICNWIFRRDFIIQNNLKFINLMIGEDQIFMMDVYRYSSAIVLKTNTLCYCYCQNSNSVMNTTKKAHIVKGIFNYCYIHENISSRSYLDIYPKKNIEDFILTFIQCSVITKILIANFNYIETKKIFKKIQKSGIFPLKKSKNFITKILSILSHSPLLTWAASPLYRKLYYPYIRIRRT